MLNPVRQLLNLEALGREIAARPLEVEDGYIGEPTAPGVGVELDERALAACRGGPLPQRKIRQPAEEGP